MSEGCGNTQATRRWVGPLLLVSLVLLGLAIVTSTGVGAVRIEPQRVLWIVLSRIGITARLAPQDLDPAEVAIVADMRLPRVLLAALVGAALATAGTAYQGLFRNPLADPYVVGASAGAALGATLAVTARLSLSLLGLSAMPLAAFCGAITAVLIVYGISQDGGHVSTVGLLLAGAAMSALVSAVVSFLMILSDRDIHTIFFWLMGGFGARSWDHLITAAPYAVLGSAALWTLARPLNAITLGEESAQHLGVEVELVKRVILVLATLVTAAAVAVSGIIGFVGLIVPHAARLLLGPDHRTLLPGAALIGALFLVLADNLARTLLAPIEIPVGILTALAGGPFFLYLLRTRKRGLGGM